MSKMPKLAKGEKTFIFLSFVSPFAYLSLLLPYTLTKPLPNLSWTSQLGSDELSLTLFLNGVLLNFASFSPPWNVHPEIIIHISQLFTHFGQLLHFGFQVIHSGLQVIFHLFTLFFILTRLCRYFFSMKIISKYAYGKPIN